MVPVILQTAMPWNFCRCGEFFFYKCPHFMMKITEVGLIDYIYGGHHDRVKND
jgi:hypothetical protein